MRCCLFTFALSCSHGWQLHPHPSLATVVGEWSYGIEGVALEQLLPPCLPQYDPQVGCDVVHPLRRASVHSKGVHPLLYGGYRDGVEMFVLEGGEYMVDKR
jgi:hypothetical protein